MSIPGDVVNVTASVKHSNKSRMECDNLTAVLHNGPWVSKVDWSWKNTSELKLHDSVIRRTEVHVSAWLSSHYF
ncbi:hypothetical protein FBUS_00947 [Fasciolopsis buskii]|uniref:Uncharacterized protein n=1 Tax=Fasciolopsis buskii TaxID=27845 RepID=A0A8E0RLM0_9TREM|nr:hypothetical protein FBUS_00947 [Fasciolopsis buski]